MDKQPGETAGDFLKRSLLESMRLNGDLTRSERAAQDVQERAEGHDEEAVCSNSSD